MIHIHFTSTSLVIRYCLPWIRYPLEYSDGGVPHWFIHALAISFVIDRITLSFLASLLGTHKLSIDFKKCQQEFLAPLQGKAHN
jgi:hypothetical protein